MSLFDYSWKTKTTQVKRIIIQISKSKNNLYSELDSQTDHVTQKCTESLTRDLWDSNPFQKVFRC